MGVDTTKASDHKSSNDLDKVDTGESDISFAFGSRTIKLDRIPAMDDVFVMVLQVKVKGDGNKRNAKGELVPRRDLTILSGWEPGKQHLADAQTGMFDTDGNVTPQAAGDDDDEDGEIPDDATEAEGGPEFSDGEK